MAGIGDFVHLVSLAKAGATPDDPEGGYTETWIALNPPTWYCSIREATARDLERISGGLTTQTATHLIRGRYHAELSKDCRIAFRNRVFDVSTVHIDDEQQATITVLAVERIGVAPVAPLPPQPPAAHAPTHQPGGTDPIGPQVPAAHAATHAAGGTDPITAPPLPSDVAITGSLAIGTNPAESGTIRLANNSTVKARNNANTADVTVFNLGTDDNLQLGMGTANGIGLGGNLYCNNRDVVDARTVGVNTSVAVGTNPAQSGAVRLANNQAITARNGANTGDQRIAAIGVDDTLFVGQDAPYVNLGVASLTISPAGTLYSQTDNAADLGWSGGRFKTAHVGTSVNVGTNPAQSGAVRLANGAAITVRDGANTADRSLVVAGPTYQVIGNHDAVTYIDAINGVFFRVSGYVDVSISRGGIGLSETPAPPTPGANSASIWLQDNGAGKSQLMIQFATGAPIAIATEP